MIDLLLETLTKHSPQLVNQTLVNKTQMKYTSPYQRYFISKTWIQLNKSCSYQLKTNNKKPKQTLQQAPHHPHSFLYNVVKPPAKQTTNASFFRFAIDHPKPPSEHWHDASTPLPLNPSSNSSISAFCFSTLSERLMPIALISFEITLTSATNSSILSPTLSNSSAIETSTHLKMCDSWFFCILSKKNIITW